MTIIILMHGAPDLLWGGRRNVIKSQRCACIVRVQETGVLRVFFGAGGVRTL